MIIYVKVLYEANKRLIRFTDDEDDELKYAQINDNYYVRQYILKAFIKWANNLGRSFGIKRPNKITRVTI